jgi:hypothetical protein
MPMPSAKQRISNVLNSDWNSIENLKVNLRDLMIPSIKRFKEDIEAVIANGNGELDGLLAGIKAVEEAEKNMEKIVENGNEEELKIAVFEFKMVFDAYSRQVDHELYHAIKRKVLARKVKIPQKVVV